MSSFLFESRFSFHNIHRTLWRDPKAKFTFDKMSEKQIFRNYAKGRLGDSTPLYCCCFSNFITEHKIFWPFFEWLWLAGDCQAAAFELMNSSVEGTLECAVEWGELKYGKFWNLSTLCTPQPPSISTDNRNTNGKITEHTVSQSWLPNLFLFTLWFCYDNLRLLCCVCWA